MGMSVLTAWISVLTYEPGFVGGRKRLPDSADLQWALIGVVKLCRQHMPLTTERPLRPSNGRCSRRDRYNLRSWVYGSREKVHFFCLISRLNIYILENVRQCFLITSTTHDGLRYLNTCPSQNYLHILKPEAFHGNCCLHEQIFTRHRDGSIVNV